MSEPVKTMYRIDSYGIKITAVEVVKETAQFVTFLEKGWDDKMRERRTSKLGHFFDTWAEARDHMLDQYARRVESAKYSLNQARTQLGMIKSLKEPTCSP